MSESAGRLFGLAVQGAESGEGGPVARVEQAPRLVGVAVAEPHVGPARLPRPNALVQSKALTEGPTPGCSNERRQGDFFFVVR